jgi:hypothetical protein
MAKSAAHRILSVVIGIAFALAANLSAAEAGSMAVDMSRPVATLDMGSHHDCGGCTDDTNKGGMKNAGCIQACIAALAAILPAELSVAPVPAVAHLAAWQTMETGRVAPPNPSPPRA